MARTKVPEATLVKIERTSGHMAHAVHQLRKATEEETIRKAEKLVAEVYLMTLHANGTQYAVGISPEESDRLCGLASERGWDARAAEPVQETFSSYDERNKALGYK